MKVPKTSVQVFLLVVAINLGLAPHVVADKPDDADTHEASEFTPTLTVDEARRQAKLLHNTYEATLHTVHREFFREGGRTPIPARVLEEVFYWVDEETHGKTRWIAVNTEAMSIDHNPESDFEKQAAKVLSTGKEEYEQVKDGMYHRAGAVQLFASCLRCHESSLTRSHTRRRVAGLVIGIPVVGSPAKDDPANDNPAKAD